MAIQKTFASLKAVALIMGFALATGCASNAAIEEAQSDAQRALEVAEEAQRTAQQAAEAARAAQRSADAAQRCCDANTEKLDRALERMQQK
ncbi:alanine-zipper protein [Marinimicrobium alkaliphilum]|uniref:alanine-zipper protein n=1 Tax=Marinimicrobium alkaliphilum TaxID=2202654 RepID=UPI000DBA15CC|nr:alanine-zipper protein [Marinimicrobium alkaliphilum]